MLLGGTLEIPGWAATLLAALVGALMLLYIHRLNNRRAAASKFRQAFSPALGRLEAAKRHNSTHDRPDVDAMLKGHFEQHSAAVHEFRPFIPPRERASLQKAWESYCSYVASASSFPSFLAEAERDEDPYGLLSERIEAITAFARYT